MITGVQQIMLGSVCGTEDKAKETLRRIRAAGYDGIELNRFMIHPASLMVRMLTRAAGMPTGSGGKLDWQKLIRESGLTVISLHADLGSLENDMNAVIEEARIFGTDRIVITGMYRFDYSDEANVRELASRLNKAGKILRDSGLRLLYHNHNVELLKVNRTDCAYDILIRETDPEYVNFEFDSYWFTDGGANAQVWMKKLGTRMKLWHINDRGSRVNGASMTPILKADSMELGTGNMDLAGLKKTADENGIEAVVLESHRNWADKDPLKSIEVSAAWLKENYG
ncbi:MAG: sugar phosphate isomerase/epimerase [Solobacterium sp.]|nr:sugar phosphate isomerase/epimerase [Solobacterium sp.]